MLLLVGLTCWVASVVAEIPAWSPTCPQQTNVPNACIFGNLQVSLFSKTLYPRDCNHNVDIKEFTNPPLISIDSTNKTETFTMVMVDAGPEGRGPNTLEWMLTNVTVDSLKHFNTLPNKYVLAGYNMKPLKPNARTLVQILVFRHHNVLRVPFGELWVTQIRGFSLSTLIINTNHTLRLCGPVAATQFWLYNSTASNPNVPIPNYTPSAPPAPPQTSGQPQWYIPVVPMVPGAPQPPVQSPPMVPGNPPVAPPATPHQHQYPSIKVPKRNAAVTLQFAQLLLIPLIVLTMMWL